MTSCSSYEVRYEGKGYSCMGLCGADFLEGYCHEDEGEGKDEDEEVIGFTKTEMVQTMVFKYAGTTSST